MERSDEGLEMARSVLDDVKRLFQFGEPEGADPLFMFTADRDGRLMTGGAFVRPEDVPGLILRALDGVQDFIETGYTDRLQHARLLPRDGFYNDRAKPELAVEEYE